jgi:hypothetical protein
MSNKKLTLLALVLGAWLSTGALAQKNDDKRPPKNPDTKVVVQDKKEREKPPPNDNQGDKRNDGKKGKP